MADEFVLPKDIGTIDCSDIQPWDRKSLRYDYILKATTGDEDYPIVPEEVGICTNLWVHGNAQIDNIQINQTITGNPTSYLGDVTAGDYLILPSHQFLDLLELILQEHLRLLIFSSPIL